MAGTVVHRHEAQPMHGGLPRLRSRVSGMSGAYSRRHTIGLASSGAG